jgi:hypothetical protein
MHLRRTSYLWVNFVLLLKTWDRKGRLENMLYMTFIEIVSFLKSLAFIQLHQSCSFQLQLQCLHNSHPVSHLQLTSDVHFQCSQLLPHPPVHFAMHSAVLKSFNCHFWRYVPMVFIHSGPAVLHWASLLFWWCRHTVLCQEPCGMRLFQIVLKGLFHWTWSYDYKASTHRMDHRSDIQC